ncbi:helix-turn-helix domain-containing protein [Streptomyces sp. HP-A2021]|uniref:helix-turn-helix domain-containing protein n=1 Tax=Streptomyces TaxID=1883 RepID=UPI0009EB0A8E|nr:MULTISPECIES: helix-turn-helix transcriptional regulator [Streptomyces]UOB14842.1 helix-turn-helix domain-containing protein [Streptomyces sp. HP-A2021]
MAAWYVTESPEQVDRPASHEERGYSLKELAERSGLSFRGLICIEHGRRNAGVLTILIIASGLNVASPKLFADVSQAADKPRPRAPTTSSWAVRQASIQRSRAEPLIGAEGRAGETRGVPVGR